MNNKTCIVIPCYNEEKRLPVQEYLDFFSKDENCWFVFVNDGSTDNTLISLQKLQCENNRVWVVDQQINKGKAEAVRAGMMYALSWGDFEMIGYFDADLATPLHEISLLNKYLNEKNDRIIAIGARWKRLGSDYYRKAMRHYPGRLFATLASITLKLPVYDTQCGAKLFKAKVVSELFSEPFISKWLFDVEIFARIIRTKGRKNIHQYTVEVPLNSWHDKGGSKLKIRDLLSAPFGLISIKRKYKL